MLKATRSDRPPVAKKEIRKESNNRQIFKYYYQPGPTTSTDKIYFFQ